MPSKSRTGKWWSCAHLHKELFLVCTRYYEKWYHGFREYSWHLRSRFRDKTNDVEILSAQPAARRNILTAEQDKRDWCKKYLPKIPVNITYRREKKNYAKGNILIDDYQSNVDAWEEAGGIGILFTGKEDVLEKLRKLNILK